MDFWILIVGMGVLTFAIRLSFIVGAERIRIPLPVRRALRFVPVAVLTAILIPEMLQPDGDFDVTNPRFFAGLIAMVIAYATKNVLWTVVGGMVSLWILQAF